MTKLNGDKPFFVGDMPKKYFSFLADLLEERFIKFLSLKAFLKFKICN